jgi:pilus assembly protein CpaF
MNNDDRWAPKVNRYPDARYQEIKNSLHQKVIEEIDLEHIDRIKEDTGREKLSQVLRDLLNQQRTPLTRQERDQLVKEIMDEVFGLGPIEPLLHDSTISDILVNGPNEVFVERRGMLEHTDIKFNNDDHLRRIIDRIVSRVGRRVDESSPMVDARLQDGSRVNVILPPLSLTGPVLSIRRFPTDRLQAADLIKNNSINQDMLDLVRAAVKGKLNIVVSGGTGAGKTTFLNILSSFIPANERIITIEDAAELELQQPHVVRLETRPANIEGRGAVKQRQLVINALRMRPDRIVVGEVRGEEAVDMLQAMNTGHEGSLTTVHANTPNDALGRIEMMVAMANLNLSDKTIRQQIASAIHLIVQISRMPDGTRKVTNICEVCGLDGSTINIQKLFTFERQGFGEDQKVRGSYRYSGLQPTFSQKLIAAGIKLPGILTLPKIKQDHYQVLGIARNASDKEIEIAYNQLIHKLHLGKDVGDVAASEEYKKAMEAYGVLNDLKSRAEYDRTGSAEQPVLAQSAANKN